MPPQGPIVQVGDILLVQLVSYANAKSQIGINVRYYNVSSEPLPSVGLRDVARTVSDYFGDAYAAVLTTTSQFLGATAARIDPDPVGASSSNAGERTGTVLGDDLPSQTSGLLSLSSGGSGRASRGRCFIPFPPEDENVDGSPSANYVSLVNSIGGLMLDQLTVDTVELDGQAVITPILYSPPDDLIPLPQAIQNLAVASAQERWATQRRRGGYGPQNPKPVL